jgi:enoyl-CoA hydratase/carnithine racemase
MSADPLLVESVPPAVVLTMNRPELRNALSMELMRAMTEALLKESARPDCRVIIIRGAGPAFSAGHDLRELTDQSIETQREIFSTCARLMQTIQEIPQPVIASVGGAAMAAGCQLVATCDLAIASEEATFATPGVKIGLFCSTPMVALSRNIGRKRAMEMLLTGRSIDARTAAEWGLINRVVPGERLEEETLQLASQIASFSPLTLKIGKAAFYRQIETDQATAYQLMSEVMAENAITCDAQEGIRAFLEKRRPKWRGQ